MRSTSSPSPRASHRRSAGKATNRSPSMCGRWLPWPGYRKATSGAAPSGSPPDRPSPPATNTPRPVSPARARATLAARSSRSSATIATWTDAPRRRSCCGAREVAEPPRPAGAVVGLEQADEAVELGDGVGRRVAADEEQLGRPLVEAVGRLVAAVVGRQHGVEVRAAEAEGADRRRRRSSPTQGRAASPNTNGLVLAVVRLVRLVEVERRRQHAVVQGVGGLDQPGDAGGALGVADLRLDRAERGRARRRAALGEHLGERGQLGAVADDRAGAVRLDQADRRTARRPAGRRPARGRGAGPPCAARSGRGCAPSLDAGDRRRSPRRCGRRRARRRRAA